MWILAILFLILFLLLYWDTIKPTNFPPGPPWLPLLGNIITLQRLRKKNGYLYKVVAKMAEKNGVIGLRIGKDKIVVGYSKEAVHEIHTNEDLQGRPRGPFYQTRTWGLRRGLLLVDETFWTEQRRFTLRHLREFGFGRRDMASMVEDESAQMIKDVKDKIFASNYNSGAVVQMNEFFGIYVLNTLWTMMAGTRYNSDDEELKYLQTTLCELFANIDMVGSLFSQFPVLQYVAPDLSGYNFFVNIHKRMWQFIRREVERHKKTYKPGELRDFIDAYLEVLQSEDKRSSFTEDQLVAVCLDLFIAGSETTSKTLSFGFLYMLVNPEVQRKAQEEIDRVVGNRMPQLIDRANMPYLEGIVLESIRMFMLRAFGVPHRALRDTKLLGYDIPKDTMILANFYGVLRDWEDPDDFRPERFIQNGRVVIPEAYTPFGFNKHRCLGESLAKANIFLFTATLLQKFNFNVVPNTEPPATCGVDSCTPATGPYYAFVTYRNKT